MRCTQGSHDRSGGRTSYRSSDIRNYLNDVWRYQAGMYNIRAGVSMQEVVYQNNSFLIQDEQKYGLGGSKIIGEMSAGASGEY